MAAGVRYGTVKVWDVATRKEKTLKGHTSDVWAVSFSLDGTAKIWKVPQLGVAEK